MSDERDNVLQLILARARDTKLGADQLGSFYRSDVQALESEVIRIEKESDARLERIGELETDITERMKISAVPESVLDRFKETLRSRTKQVDGQCVTIRELQAEVALLKEEIGDLEASVKRSDAKVKDHIYSLDVEIARLKNEKGEGIDAGEYKRQIEDLKKAAKALDLKSERMTVWAHSEAQRYERLKDTAGKAQAGWFKEEAALKAEIERLKNEKTHGISDVVGRQQ